MFGTPTEQGDLDMRMPSHTALCSFVFSTILTSALIPSSGDVALASAGAPAVQMAVQSALNGLRAQGFSGGAELMLPPTATSPTSAAAPAVAAGPAKLTPELLGKLLQLNALKGIDRANPAAFANTLGLGAPGQDWPDRDSAFTGTDNFIHGFAVNRGTDQDVLLYINRPDSILAFRSTRDGTGVAGLSFDRATKVITLLPIDKVQAWLEVEFGFWGRGIDKILSDNK